jgi:general nucleoside transport system permease protein
MSQFKAYVSKEKNQRFLVPLIAILGGFLVGIIIMLVTGKNPINAFIAIIKSTFGYDLTTGTFNSRLIGELIITTAPLIFTGLALAFAFKTGLFNIGAEGQVIMGAYAAIAIGFLIDAPRLIHLPLVIIAAGLAGALWAFIPGILKARYNVHEVVTTIMLNYTALHVSNYLLKRLPLANSQRTEAIPASATFHSAFLRELTNNSRLHWGFLLAILGIFVYWFIINKTSFGYELRAVGLNKHAAEYAGMKVNRNIVYSMMISGAFAGLAGALISVGTFDYGRIMHTFENYGFDGIAVALVGNNSAIGVLLSGFLFGALKTAQPQMQNLAIPREIAIIIQSSIVVFVAMQYGIRKYLSGLTTKANLTQVNKVLEPSNEEGE